MPEVSVKTRKGFLNEGVYTKRGKEIEVDELRARELHRNGLIEDYEVKSAPESQNKQAPAPANKAVKPKPDPLKKD